MHRSQVGVYPTCSNYTARHLEILLRRYFYHFLAKGVRVSVPGGVWTGHAAVKKEWIRPKDFGAGYV